ncbi:hypothetical protein AMECASPLE_027374 [Ameca splendens]|uniref:Uncharacterized protein n=1 Tax=Ameca splendens TaxID=208324 RepID=A0ABV0XI69_9TELE
MFIQSFLEISVSSSDVSLRSSSEDRDQEFPGVSRSFQELVVVSGSFKGFLVIKCSMFCSERFSSYHGYLLPGREKFAVISGRFSHSEADSLLVNLILVSAHLEATHQNLKML